MPCVLRDFGHVNKLEINMHAITRQFLQLQKNQEKKEERKKEKKNERKKEIKKEKKRKKKERKKRNKKKKDKTFSFPFPTPCLQQKTPRIAWLSFKVWWNRFRRKWRNWRPTSSSFSPIWAILWPSSEKWKRTSTELLSSWIYTKIKPRHRCWPSWVQVCVCLCLCVCLCVCVCVCVCVCFAEVST